MTVARAIQADEVRVAAVTSHKAEACAMEAADARAHAQSSFFY
jgi:hypothetical protein